MIKEELKQEAEEWIKDHSGLIGSYKFVKFDYDSMQKAYLASAEPREKRITELEKENAELKNERNAFKIYSDGAELDAINLNDQLTKAKKFLKRVVTDFHNMDCVSVHIDKTIAEAEQFIKENSTYERIQKAKYNYAD